MSRIFLQFIVRHLQEIEQCSSCRLSFRSVHRFFQPIISLIYIHLRSKCNIIDSFNAQCFIFRRYFYTFSQEFLSILHTQIVRIHQLIKILFVFCRVSVFDLPQQPFQNFITVCEGIETKSRAVLQNSFPRSISIFKVTSFHCFVRNTTVRITISVVLCYHSCCSRRKKQHSHKRFNFHCI